MVKRKSISKKTRFEVFKRDSFKCQYCGGIAPDVLLEIDHIKPVKEGGGNSIINLITSCRDCNQGKGARLLSDDSTLKRQQKQLEELNERRLQLEMMVEWRESMSDLEEQQVDVIESELYKQTGYYLSDTGRQDYRMALKNYGLQNLLDSVDKAVYQYLKYDKNGTLIDNSVTKVFNNAIKIAKFEHRNRDKPYMKDLFYIRGIMKNRFSINEWEVLPYLEEQYLMGVPMEELKYIAEIATSWSNYQEAVEDYTESNFPEVN